MIHGAVCRRKMRGSVDLENQESLPILTKKEGELRLSSHAFMLLGPNSQVLMNTALPPVKETAYVFTFHEEGLFSFVCSLHPNAMFGQILVLPPRRP